MTRYKKMIEEIEGKEENEIPYQKKEEISNAIFEEYLNEDHQKEYLAFDAGYTDGKGWHDPLEIMNAYLYWLLGYDCCDALRELDEDNEWEGLK